MLEVLVGGIIVAVSIGPLVKTLGDARAHTVVASRNSVAQSLAVQGVEKAMAIDYSLLSSSNFPTTETVAAQQGEYKRRYFLSRSSSTLAGRSVDSVRVTCEVSFVFEGITHDAVITTVRYESTG